MGLEHWDGKTKKFLLYRDAAQHSADCVRFPFEDIPRRVFLDTNVINILVKHSAHVFDQELSPPNIDSTLAVDIEALMHVFYIGARADWSLITSPKTIDELRCTKNEELRADLIEYALGLVNQDASDEDHRFAADFARRLIGTPFVAALPDLANQELLGYAIGYGCDAFCTRDRATIVKKRFSLKQITLPILTPAEWWAHIKPWAALWS